MKGQIRDDRSSRSIRVGAGVILAGLFGGDGPAQSAQPTVNVMTKHEAIGRFVEAAIECHRFLHGHWACNRDQHECVDRMFWNDLDAVAFLLRPVQVVIHLDGEALASAVIDGEALAEEVTRDRIDALAYEPPIVDESG
jgi:hypothetical protein